jgi:hypothetical protein
MPFTNLNRKIDTSKRLHRNKPRSKGGFKKFLVRTIIVLLILFVAVYLPVRFAYSSAKRMVADSRALSTAAKNQNLDDIKKSVDDMKSSNGTLNLSLKALFWVRIIPYFGGFYADALHFSNAAGYEFSAANKIIKALEPDKAELGFTGQPTPGTDRVAQMVKVMDKVIPQLDKVEPEFKSAAKEVSSIDASKYPDKFGTTTVRSKVETAKNFIGGIDYAVTQAKPAIEIAPSALGDPTPKTYLIIFQNDKELRSTGGFMTAYSFLKLDHGHVSSTGSDDIYRLDEQLLHVCEHVICPLTPPAPIAKYLPNADGSPRTAWSMRDSNFSPDVPTSLKTFEKMYGFLPGAQQFDGVILIDTKVVETLIGITGPIDVDGTNYSDDINKTCDCSDVVYELENYSQIVEKGELNRKAVLGTLMSEILQRSLGASTEKLPEFINAGIEMANNKHIMVFMHDQKSQDALTALNWTGIIQNPNTDYLHINDSNFAGAKSNLYVVEDVTLDINIAKDGTVTDKVTTVYNNPMAYGAWLNAINRDYIRIYTPQGSKLVNSDKPLNALDDLGHTVFENFVQVRPQNKLTVTYEYQLPNKFNGGKYPILIQKQPGTKDFHYVININGSKKADFMLDSDKNLTLGI